MAADKSTKPKRKASSPTSAAPTSAAPTSAAPKSAAPTSAAPTSAAPTSAAPTSAAPRSAAPKSAAAGTHLRQLGDPRHERRYQPSTSAFAIGTVVLFSFGAVALGAGVYAQWLRSGDAGPHPWSLYFLIAGVVLLVAVALFGQSDQRPVRVGDGGVAVERDETTLERVGWCDISRLLVTADAVTVQGNGVTIGVPRNVHGLAAARIVREARERVPEKVEGDPSAEPPAAGVEPPNEPLEPPQIAGRACKATGKVVSFEKDARLCGRCGELYHKAGVPDRCLTCEARLK